MKQLALFSGKLDVFQSGSFERHRFFQPLFDVFPIFLSGADQNLLFQFVHTVKPREDYPRRTIHLSRQITRGQKFESFGSRDFKSAVDNLLTAEFAFRRHLSPSFSVNTKKAEISRRSFKIVRS